MEPYRLIIMVLVVLVLLVAITQYPHCKPLNKAHEEKPSSIGETLRYLSKNPAFIKGIITQFMYVGVQTALWSFTIRLALHMDSSINERSASNYMIFAFIAFFIGKMLANFLMTRFNQDMVLIAYSVLGMVALVYVISVPNFSAVWAAVFASAMLGPGWATIYARTLDTVEDKRFTETAGAIIVMAIIGGAVIPVIQGLISDLAGSMQFSFIINILCFGTMALYFWDIHRQAQKGKVAA